MKAITILLALCAGATNAQTIDNWLASGQPVKNTTGLCWRDANWTPATAHSDCDGALKPVPAPVKVAEVKVDVTKPTATLAQRAPVERQTFKTTYSAETLFDFDKAVLKPEGKAVLDTLASKLKDIDLEIIITVGHTDSVGTVGYNMKLGLRRAQAVRAYFISKGVPLHKVTAETRGESAPIADNKTAQGRAKNRRVEIEVIGTVKQ